jgi:hypothetical protein
VAGRQRSSRGPLILVIVIVGLALVAAAILAVGQRPGAPTVSPSDAPSAEVSVGLSLEPSLKPGAARLLPDQALTPGAINPAVTQANIHSTICVSGYTKTIRPPAAYTTKLKIAQIKAYGYADTKTADYEEDHLISLEIGGAPKDPKNLWPEAYAATAPDGSGAGAKIKDRIENWLHAQICSGGITLAAAQTEISHDWYVAWQNAGRP